MDNAFAHYKFYRYINTVEKEMYTDQKSRMPIPQAYMAETEKYSKLCECLGIEIGESFAYFTLRTENELPMVMFSRTARKQNATSLCGYTQCVSWPYAKGLLNGGFEQLLNFGFYSEEEVDALAAGAPVPEFGAGSKGRSIGRDSGIEIAPEALTAVLTRVILRWLEGSDAVTIAVPKSETANYNDYVLRAVSELYSYFPAGLRAEAGFSSYLTPAKQEAYPRIHIAFVPESEADAKTVFLNGASPLAYAKLTRGATLPALKAFIAHLVGLTDRKEREEFLANVFEDLEGGSSDNHLMQFRAVTGLTYNRYGKGLKILDSKETNPVELIRTWLEYMENREEREKYPRLCGTIDRMIGEKLTPEGYREYMEAAFEGKDLNALRKLFKCTDTLVSLSARKDEFEAIRNELGAVIAEQIARNTGKQIALKSSADAGYYDDVMGLIRRGEQDCAVFSSAEEWTQYFAEARRNCGRAQAKQALRQISELQPAGQDYGDTVSETAALALARCDECGVEEGYSAAFAEARREAADKLVEVCRSSLERLDPEREDYGSAVSAALDNCGRQCKICDPEGDRSQQTEELRSSCGEKIIAQLKAALAALRPDDADYEAKAKALLTKGEKQSGDCGLAQVNKAHIDAQKTKCGGLCAGVIVKALAQMDVNAPEYVKDYSNGVAEIERIASDFGLDEEHGADTLELKIKGEERLVDEIKTCFVTAEKWLNGDYMTLKKNVDKLGALIVRLEEMIIDTDSRRNLLREVKDTLESLKTKLSESEGRRLALLEDKKNKDYFEAVRDIGNVYEQGFRDEDKEAFCTAYFQPPYNNAVNVPKTVKEFEERFKDIYGRELSAEALAGTGSFCARVFVKLLEKLYTLPQPLDCGEGGAAASLAAVERALTKAKQIAPGVAKLSFNIDDKTYDSTELIKLFSFDFSGLVKNEQMDYDTVRTLAKCKFFKGKDVFLIQRVLAPYKKNILLLNDVLSEVFSEVDENMCFSLFETQAAMLSDEKGGMYIGVERLNKNMKNSGEKGQAVLEKLTNKHKSKNNGQSKKAVVTSILLGVTCAAMLGGGVFLYTRWDSTKKQAEDLGRTVADLKNQLTVISDTEAKKTDELVWAYQKLTETYFNPIAERLWRRMEAEPPFALPEKVVEESETGEKQTEEQEPPYIFNGLSCLSEMQELLNCFDIFRGILPTHFYYEDMSLISQEIVLGSEDDKTAGEDGKYMIVFTDTDEEKQLDYAAVYFGDVVDGKKNGNGIMLVYALGLETENGEAAKLVEYSGQWADDLPNGEGALRWYLEKGNETWGAETDQIGSFRDGKLEEEWKASEPAENEGEDSQTEEDAHNGVDNIADTPMALPGVTEEQSDNI